MSKVEHADLVRSLVKPGEQIIVELTPAKANAWHAATGIAGESGEIVDAVKRWTIYDKPIDRAHVVEELGDLEFFLEQLRQELGITREETIANNIEKLGKRYHEGRYSNQQAQERADKVGRS